MSHFYQQLLEQNEQEHSAAVQAISNQSDENPSSAHSKKNYGPSVPEASGPNLTITRPPDLGSLSDLAKAQLAMSEGKDVELNDDNQIVDHRDLLSAGLNLSAPNTRRLGLTLGKRKADEDEKGHVESHRAVGTAASRREIQARREREIEMQLKEEQRREADESRRLEEERVLRVVQKRNNDNDVKSARERYLERKRRKLEELSGIVAASDGGEG